MSGHTTTPRAQCQNCGAALIGPYCAQCGQHDVDYHQSIRHIVEDFAEGFFHLDGKFFRSLRYLFTRPGFMTREFLSGRRARFANPIRFYIFASFLFFIVAAITSSKMVTDTPEAKAKAAAAKTKDAEALKRVEQESPELRQILDKNAAAKPTGGTTRSAFVRKLFDPGTLNQKEWAAEFRHLLPTMLFFCLPFLALVLRVVYLHSNRYYVEHLIFALHLQAFVFLAELAREGITWCCARISDGFGQSANAILFIGIAWLIYRSFRTVYGQGRWKTVLKFGLVSFAYSLVLLVAMGATLLVSATIISNGA